MIEKECSRSVQHVLAPFCDDYYSHEVGALLERRDGKIVGRRGGTRTTPGYPDLTFYMRQPVQYVLTVEAKGATTRIRPDQWVFARRRMWRGEPHLIVRSAEALMVGLYYLELLPFAPSASHNWSTVPENWLFLPETKRNFWDWIDEPMEKVAHWQVKRKLKTPDDVDVLIVKEAYAEARLAARGSRQ